MPPKAMSFGGRASILDAALDCGYIDAATHDKLDTEWERIGGKLNRMIQYSESLCQ